MRGVGERVAFRVPLGVLGAATQSGDFGKMRQPAGFLQHVEAAGGTGGLSRPLVPFAPHALHREFVECIGNAATERGGLGREGEVKASGELEGAQHPERVLGEGGAGMAQNAVAQVALTAMRIEDFAGKRVAGERVDREVAPGGSFGVAE